MKSPNRAPPNARRRRGFSLLEMITALAILAVLGAVAVPAMERMKRKNQLNNHARKALGDLRQARMLGASGKIVHTPPTPPPPPCVPPAVCPAAAPPPPSFADPRVRIGGIRIASTTSYMIFGDDDNIQNNGGERDIGVVDFLVKDPSSPIRIIEPPVGTELRFYSTGISTSGAQRLTLQDQVTLEQKTILISPAGMAKFL